MQKKAKKKTSTKKNTDRVTKKIKYTAPDHSKKVIKDIEAKYRAMYETNMIGIAHSDLEDKIIEANDVFLDLVGYTRKDLQSGKLTWSSITPKEFNALDNKKVKEILRYGRTDPFEKVYLHKNGNSIPVLVGAESIPTDPVSSISFALDISHRKKMEQRKDDFVATVSHELKTPLAVLKIHTDLLQILLDKGAPRKEIDRNLSEIGNQIARLTVIINDFANLTRIQTSKDEGKLFNVRDAITEVVESTKLVHDHEIVLNKSEGWTLVRGNREQLNLVFRNLISNAIRYSPKNKPVHVSLKRKGKHVVVSVKDKGIGIPKKDQKIIFDRFYRTDIVRADTEGLGIGLHICKEIIESHRGYILIDSTLGKGSKFTCYIPLVLPNRSAKRR